MNSHIKLIVYWMRGGEEWDDVACGGCLCWKKKKSAGSRELIPFGDLADAEFGGQNAIWLTLVTPFRTTLFSLGHCLQNASLNP
jgi:hypothetical protein